MSRSTVELVGGPIDGAQSSVTRKSQFLWFDARKPYLAYPQRGPHRLLFRRDGRTDGGTTKYVYAHLTHPQCPGCAAYVDLQVDGSATACSLCGHALVRN